MKKLIIFVALLSLSFLTTASAADEPAKERKKEPIVTSEIKNIQGELIWVGRNFISLVYERNDKTGEEKEIRLDLDPKTVVLEHIRSIGQLNAGDTIFVTYVDETEDYGTTKKNTLRIKTIRFLRPAAADSPYKSKKDVEPSTEESLSLKGVKSDE